MISDNNIFQPFIILGIILFSVAAVISLYFSKGSSQNYYSNEFVVSLNNTKMKYIYRETFNNKVTKENYDVGENFQDIIITKTDSLLLDFKEYEVYDINNLRINGSFYNKLNEEKKYVYKIVNNDVKLKIKKEGNVLYNGKYTENIASYLNETGRYYMHIYNTRNEHGNKIYTDLSMTFMLINGEVYNDR